jgi:hypothetical protein
MLLQVRHSSADDQHPTRLLKHDEAQRHDGKSSPFADVALFLRHPNQQLHLCRRVKISSLQYITSKRRGEKITWQSISSKLDRLMHQNLKGRWQMAKPLGMRGVNIPHSRNSMWHRMEARGTVMYKRVSDRDGRSVKRRPTVRQLSANGVATYR